MPNGNLAYPNIMDSNKMSPQSPTGYLPGRLNRWRRICKPLLPVYIPFQSHPQRPLIRLDAEASPIGHPMIPATEERQRAFLSALLQGDRQLSAKIALDMAESPEAIKNLYENVLKTSMYSIGLLWEHGRISVASEHIASAIVEGVMNDLYARMAMGQRRNRTAVAACVEQEKHQIGIKMVADLFEMHGWNVFFLGADTPCQELIRFMRDAKADVLALSLSIYFHVPILEKMLTDIRGEFPALPILVGGQAFRHGGSDLLARYDGVEYASDLNELETWLQQRDDHGQQSSPD